MVWLYAYIMINGLTSWNFIVYAGYIMPVQALHWSCWDIDLQKNSQLCLNWASSRLIPGNEMTNKVIFVQEVA